jgi:chorismate-pyruvate lyase
MAARGEKSETISFGVTNLVLLGSRTQLAIACHTAVPLSRLPQAIFRTLDCTKLDFMCNIPPSKYITQ